MKLKNALRKDPPTTDPKLYLKYLPTGVQQLEALPPFTYQSAAFPDTIKLTILLNKYMNLSGTVSPI